MPETLSLKAVARTELAEVVYPAWLQKPLTGKRVIWLLVWWMLAVLLTPVAMVVGIMMGGVKGVAGGITDAVREVYKDLQLVWKLVEGKKR